MPLTEQEKEKTFYAQKEKLLKTILKSSELFKAVFQFSVCSPSRISNDE